MTILRASLALLGLITAIGLPLAYITFPVWEWRLLCWLDNRRRRRETRPYRFAKWRPR